MNALWMILVYIFASPVLALAWLLDFIAGLMHADDWYDKWVEDMLDLLALVANLQKMEAMLCEAIDRVTGR